LGKLLSFFLLFFSAVALTAQTDAAADALSRMESAINNSQEEFTTQENYFLGRSVAAHILTRYKIYTEKPALTQYLNLICNVLAVNSPIPYWYDGYRVMILDDPAPNAFATSGGHIYITRGFINLASSEDMLAAIIAHEMMHVQLQHGFSEIMQSRLNQELNRDRTRILQEIENKTQQQMFTETVNEMAQTLLGKGYSQLQEFEADRMAYTLLAAAGYNPGNFIELLKILEQLQGNQAASLNNSHPLPSQRIANLSRQTPVIRQTENSSIRRERFNRIVVRGEE